MNPLAQNCQGYTQDGSGRVTGVQLGVTIVPGAKYEVYSVTLVDEASASGNTVAYCSVVDKNGISTGEQVILTWPGQNVPFQDGGIAGNGRNEHVISNKYNPPAIGPLAVHVGSLNKPASDIIYGLGLPFGHHVSYRIIFREKGSVIVTPPADNSWQSEALKLESNIADLLTRIVKLENDNNRVKALEAWATKTSTSHPELPKFS